jgi:hypothetical protein
MVNTFAVELTETKNLPQASERIQDILRTVQKTTPSARVAIVLGVTVSDGPEFTTQNINRLRVCSDYIRRRHDFPVFSLIDIFPENWHLENQDKSRAMKEYQNFWKSLLLSGSITDVFVTPRWESNPELVELHSIAQKAGIHIHYWDIFDLYPTYRS